jgi:gamma-glutamyl-gamma-aminobutyrate hydrolase PuuD
MRFINKDFVILPGGADIDPALYGKKNYDSHVSDYSRKTDAKEIEIYRKAVKEGRPIFGICRGLQLLAAMNGLTLIQDLNHPHEHYVNIRNLDSDEFDGSRIYTNSCHHQAVWTENKLQGNNFEVYGATNLSRQHKYQEDENIICTVEPEIVWFPEVKALGVQFHPEWMSEGGNYKECLDYLSKLINKLY